MPSLPRYKTEESANTRVKLHQHKTRLVIQVDKIGIHYSETNGNINIERFKCVYPSKEGRCFSKVI